MAEYIKREDVMAHLRECEGTPPEICYTYPIFKAIECFVKDMPAADVVEVVRCEDSAHGCRLNREKTERGTTFTFSGGTKCTFGPESRSELFQALEKLYTLEQAMDEGRLVMRPRKPYEPPEAEIIDRSLMLYGEGGDHA